MSLFLVQEKFLYNLLEGILSLHYILILQEHDTNLYLSLIHISEPTRLHKVSRMPSSA